MEEMCSGKGCWDSPWGLALNPGCPRQVRALGPTQPMVIPCQPGLWDSRQSQAASGSGELFCPASVFYSGFRLAGYAFVQPGL